MNAVELELFRSEMPEPTKDEPFAQIDFVFARRASLTPSPRSSDHYTDTCKNFKEFLSDLADADDLAEAGRLSEAFSWDVHFRFYKWISSQKSYTDHTVTGRLGTLKQVVLYARAHKFITHEVFFVTKKNPDYTPATEARTAYDEDLYGPIRDLLERQYRHIRRTLNHMGAGAAAPSIGRDPREPRPLKWGTPALLPVLDAVRGYTTMGLQPPSLAALARELGIGPDDVKRALLYWAEKGVFEKCPPQGESGCIIIRYRLKAEPDAAMLRDADSNSYGWKQLDNLIWYIVNVLGGVIPYIHNGRCSRNQDLPDRKIIHAVISQGGIKKIKALLEERRVWYTTTKRLEGHQVGTLMAMLALITGLNVEALKDLRTDCIKIEPISGKPCLQYTKLRSKGKRGLALYDDEDRELYSDSPEAQEGRQSLLFFDLLPGAAKVQEIIETAILLTKEIRKEAPADVADFLFIYKSSSRMGGVVRQVTNGVTSISWVRKFRADLADFLKQKARKQGLDPAALRANEQQIDEQVMGATINLSKFRSTLATELALAGAPIEIIQAVLGHRKRHTTQVYLEAHRMEVAYHQEVSEALQKMKNHRNLHLVHAQSEETLAKRIGRSPAPDNTSTYIFATGTPLFCRNPYQPSENIKASIKDWVDGESTCHCWNKCLFCDKVIIVDLALPKLIAYRNQLKLSLEGDVDDIPGKGALVVKTVSLIDKILDPQSGFFDEKTVADARTRADVLSSQDLDRHFYEGVGAWV